MMWRRHRGDSKFHAGAPCSGSFATFCNGRWPLTDESDPLTVERHPSPPHADRCEACQRQAIEVARIDTGLRDLVDNAFDLGGEA